MIPISSEVAVELVDRRKEPSISLSVWTPNTVLVFPTSMVSSMADTPFMIRI